MAAETVRIDIQVKDKTNPGLASAKKNLAGFEKAIRRTHQQMEKMTREKWNIMLQALDKVSGVVGPIWNKLKSLTEKAWSLTIKAVDKASDMVKPVMNQVKSLTGKAWSFTLKAIDKVTSPVKSALSAMDKFLGASDAVSAALKGFTLKDVLQASSDMQKVQIQLQAAASLKGIDGEGLDNILDKAKSLSKASLYTEEALVGAAAELTDYFKEADAIAKMMEATAEYAAAMSGGTELSASELAAYGATLGKLTTGAYDEIIGKGREVTQAQKDILRTGSDLEKVAVIEKIVGDNWGDMSKAMANTPTSWLTRLKNAWNGIHSTIGKELTPALIEFYSMMHSKIPGITGLVEKVAGKAGAAFGRLVPAISGWIDIAINKAGQLADKISELVGSDDFQNAAFFGKIEIAWETLIARPFESWWNGAGKPFFAEKAKELGSALGQGITWGIAGLLGIDISGAAGDGIGVGQAFASGFADGFDGTKIKEAIWNAIKSVWSDALTLLPGGKEKSATAWLSAGAIALALNKLGVFKLLGAAGNGIAGLLTGGSGASSGSMVTTMTVNAGLVYVNGGFAGNAGNAAAKVLPRLLQGGQAGGGAGRTLLQLPAGRQAGSALGRTAVSGLAKVGTAFGSQAGTVGAAAAGTAAISGIALGIAGIGSGIYDIYKGFKSDDKEESRKNFFGGGTKIGMVGTGAAIGTAILPGFGTAIGAGIGGIAALVGGSKVGGWLAEQTAEGGGMNNAWKTVQGGAASAWEIVQNGASGAWNAIQNGAASAGSALSSAWNGVSGWFDSAVWTPVRDMAVSRINFAVGIWKSASGFVKGAWANVTGWFGENIWNPIKAKAAEVGENIRETWNDAKVFVQEKWDGFTGWFDESIWSPIKAKAAEAGENIRETWNGAKAFVQEKWDSFTSWFDESIWSPIKAKAGEVGENIRETWSEAKEFILEKWDGVTTWFAEDVWAPISTKAQEIATGISENWHEAKDTLQKHWSTAAGWFSDNVWTPIQNGATAAAKWASQKWQSAKNWITGISDSGAEVTGLTTSQGYSTVLAHAEGGILTKPHLGLVAEAGAEAIIPLSPSKRGRGLALWQQAGELLGVQQPYAEGSIMGQSTAQPVQVNAGGGSPVRIENKVELHPEFVFSGAGELNEQAVVSVIKARISEMADDISDEIAEKLVRIFANRPLKGGA